MCIVEYSNYNGDFEAFCDACYAAYTNVWRENPKFQCKPVSRNRQLIDDKEQDFWGCVEGHGNKEPEMHRYGCVGLIGYVLNPHNLSNEDVKFFRRLHNRKIRVEIFSEKKKYLVVLQEIGNIKRYHLITAHPLTSYQLGRKQKQYSEYVLQNGEPI